MVYKPSVFKRNKIKNHKPVTDNSVNALLTSAGFNKYELNVALDIIKNAKTLV